MDKRFYWIKLKTDFFNTATIDFLMSQKNGCEYVVLYQMLCLQTANTEGTLVSRIGEIIVPYDVNKIVRDTKYFSVDTVTVALELFKQLGLIYKEDNNVLRIADFSEMVGSECSSAKRVREHRERKALQCNTDVTQEIEYRDKSKEIDNKDNINKKDDTKVSSKKENDDAVEIENEIVKYTFNDRVRASLREFVEYRRQKKEKMSPKAFRMMLNKLDGFTDDEKIDALETSMIANWTGVFPKHKDKIKTTAGQVAHSVHEYNENIDMEAYLEERRRRGV